MGRLTVCSEDKAHWTSSCRSESKRENCRALQTFAVCRRAAWRSKRERRQSHEMWSAALSRTERKTPNRFLNICVLTHKLATRECAWYFRGQGVPSWASSSSSPLTKTRSICIPLSTTCANMTRPTMICSTRVWPYSCLSVIFNSGKVRMICEKLWERYSCEAQWTLLLLLFRFRSGWAWG